MLVDFCNGQFDAKITCDKVSADHYEVTNLVSQDWAKRRRGFLAETFIKPPVIVTVAFPCNIEVFRIVIDPKVGRQTSSAIEIFSYSKKVDKTWLNGLPEQSACDTVSIKPSCMIYQQVGKVLMQDPGLLCFSNVQYRPFGEWQPDRNTPASTDFPNAQDLRHHKLSSLSFVSHISIRVSRTINGSAVGIQRLEIWGQPSRSCPTDIANRIKTLYLSSLPANVQKTQTRTKEVEKPVTTNISVDIYNENGIEVPKDFVDKIICDIMTVPMLLPCGENIDQMTLEKHNSNEASWGRPPSDPYTGIHFHGNLQPIPNTSLKARIDKFVLAHSETLGHLPRTLGKSNKYTSKRPLASKIVSQNMAWQSVQEICEVPVSNKRTIHNVTDTVEFATGVKRFRNSEIFRENVKSETNISASNSVTKLHKGLPRRSQTLMSDKSEFTHGDSLKYSLDSALTSTLASLPSFTNFSSNSKNHHSQDSCGRACCVCYKDSSVMYKGLCEHLMCRECLTSTTDTSTLICSTCKTVWDKGEITRVHT
ncbi:RING finger protein 37-like [Argopecten irradians]|uniref:RING finger protein 37-like n=1 Tax=Argopecten irradians TaxID=31199 RepID=UPI003714C549